MSDMGCDSFERGERLAAKAERAKIANEEKDKQHQQHTQWVQHFSGQGEKYKLRNCGHNQMESYKTWIIELSEDGLFNVAFPRSEYRPCPPPERWEVVKDAFVVDEEGKKVCINSDKEYWCMWVMDCDNERFVVTDGALVLERKVGYGQEKA